MNEQLDHELEVEEMETIGDENETKAEKFRRLANHRLYTAIKRIRMFKPLASANYDYDEDQVRFLLSALRNEVDAIEAAFFSTIEDDDIPQL